MSADVCEFLEGVKVKPLDYLVSHGCLGWTICPIGSDFSVCVDQSVALAVVKMQQCEMRIEMLENKVRRLENESAS